MHFDTADFGRKQNNFTEHDSSNSLNLLDITFAEALQQKIHKSLEGQEKINRAIEALPDHPVKDVMRELTNGVLSGKMNQSQLAKKMKELAAAVANNDARNLPPILPSDDIAASTTLEKQLFKAIAPLNRLLRERGMSVEFWSEGKIVVISNGYGADIPTNIAVLQNGEVKPYTGRHPAFHPNEYNEISLEQAVQALNKHAREYRRR